MTSYCNWYRFLFQAASNIGKKSLIVVEQGTVNVFVAWSSAVTTYGKLLMLWQAAPNLPSDATVITAPTNESYFVTIRCNASRAACRGFIPNRRFSTAFYGFHSMLSFEGKLLHVRHWMETFLIAWQESHHNIAVTSGRTTSSFIDIGTSTRNGRITNATRNLVDHTFLSSDLSKTIVDRMIVNLRSWTVPLVVVPAADFPNWSKATIPIVSWLFSPIWNLSRFLLTPIGCCFSTTQIKYSVIINQNRFKPSLIFIQDIIGWDWFFNWLWYIEIRLRLESYNLHSSDSGEPWQKNDSFQMIPDMVHIVISDPE